MEESSAGSPSGGGKRRVVVLGGGFAGVKCARTLRRGRPREELEVVLFNRENHMVFHPLLAEVAGGSIDPDAVAAPLRQMLPGVYCRTEDVLSIDLDGQRVRYETFEGGVRELAYDHLVIACGNVPNLALMPGMADHAFALKTVGDAIELRAHVMQQMERAEVADDPERRRHLLSFVVVGGGYSGVEAAGEINDLVRASLRWFANLREEDVSVTLVHSRDHLLPEISESLREFALRKMREAGVRVLLNARVAVATSTGVALKDGSEVAAGTIVCTIGSTLSPVVARLDVEKERGRLVTAPDMRLAGHDRVWAAGDCAHVINEHDGSPAPPTGQFAEREGRQCAENVLRALAGEPTRPFSFEPLGQLCSIGHHNAVAELLGVRLSGFVAWWLWRSIYLFKLPTWSRRIKVGFDWAWQLVFSRDLAHLKTRTTERVTRAYFRPGDFVFHQGDPATTFYAIESGEVEVVREEEGREPERLAVLGAGDFFGEVALVESAPRNAGVRAIGEVELVVIGKSVFERIAGSLGVLRGLLEEAIASRRGAAAAVDELVARD